MRLLCFFTLLLCLHLSNLSLLETDDFIVEKKIEKDKTMFTEGLFFDEPEFLFESGGLLGQSKLVKYSIDQPTKPLVNIQFPSDVFLEGISKVRNTIFALTYTERIVYKFEDVSKGTNHSIVEGTPKTLLLPSELREGWGMTYDGEYLIISDGTNKLFFIDFFSDPNQLKVVKTIHVENSLGEQMNSINELEYVDNIIFANIFLSNDILLINPQTGDVIKRINFEKLVHLEAAEDPNKILGGVLNGIAYNPKENYFVFTGKNWNYLYVVKFK